MRWVVRIAPEDGDGEFSTDSGAISIERSRLVDAADLGLTLDDGKRIMAFLKKRVVADQLREYCKAVQRYRAG
jgi:hypothetical protein